MYIICYTLPNGVNTWETAPNECFMQIRVCELMEKLNCSIDDIKVFDKKAEL